MFVINNRNDLLSTLIRLRENHASQKNTTNRKSDLQYLKGVDYGIALAIDLIGVWQTQVPDATDDFKKSTGFNLPEVLHGIDVKEKPNTTECP